MTGEAAGACRRCCWFQIKVRSSSSCRQVWTHHSMIEFMRDRADIAVEALRHNGRLLSPER
jgi:hypothetical protein